MITKELIERINYLSRKSRSEGLTEEEKEEQAKVRRQYVDAIKMRVKDTLDRVEFVDAPESCQCGHDHHHGHCSHKKPH